MPSEVFKFIKIIMLANTFYHIYNRGNNRENIFKEEINYQYFLDKFSFYLNNKIDVFAYCLMPNHFHFLIKTKNTDDQTSEVLETSEVLTKAFKDFFITYSKSINKMYNRTGSLFQSKFKKRIINKETYLYRLIPYIHNNPVRAGLVEKAEDWKYSSYNSFLDKSFKNSIKDVVLEYFGSVDNFVRFHLEYQNYQKERDFLFKRDNNKTSGKKLPKSAFRLT